MREIKFRSWSEMFNSYKYFNSPEDLKWFFGGGNGPERTLTECKLEQYTGLKDKNGVEIYEGDIVKFEAELVGEKDFFGTVVFLEGGWTVDNGKEANILWQECGAVEIIGNIHENL